MQIHTDYARNLRNTVKIKQFFVSDPSTLNYNLHDVLPSTLVSDPRVILDSSSPHPGGQKGILQGPEKNLRQREETRREGIALHFQGSEHHCLGRLAQGQGVTQELDQVVVCFEARIAIVV